MPNYKIVIQYKGTNYAGWQIQKNASTVQQVITDSIEKITQNKINLIGSGRTDSGVHAMGQVANFKTAARLDKFKFIHSLNSVLPKDISVLNIEEVSESFHARFDAVKRSYIYLISTRKSPFYNDFSYTVSWIDDKFIEQANELSKTLSGEYDFTSFSKKNSDVKTHICDIKNIHWRKSGFIVYFYIEANRFLHGMVRAIIGSIIDGVRLKKNPDYLEGILKECDRDAAGMAAPAKGLFLYKVKY